MKIGWSNSFMMQYGENNKERIRISVHNLSRGILGNEERLQKSLCSKRIERESNKSGKDRQDKP